MKVFSLDGRDLGEIEGITPTGANDVLEVRGAYERSAPHDRRCCRGSGREKQQDDGGSPGGIDP